LELAPCIADPACLAGASGRVVLWVEVEDDPGAVQRLERDDLARVARETEIRGGLAFLDHRRESLATVQPPAISGLSTLALAAYTETWPSEPGPNGSRVQSAHRSRNVSPASRAMRSISGGQA